MEEISLTEKNKTLKHLKHIVKQYDKPDCSTSLHLKATFNLTLKASVVLHLDRVT